MSFASANNSTGSCSGSVVGRRSVRLAMHWLIGAITNIYEATSAVALLGFDLLVDEPKAME